MCGWLGVSGREFVGLGWCPVDEFRFGLSWGVLAGLMESFGKWGSNNNDKNG